MGAPREDDPSRLKHPFTLGIDLGGTAIKSRILDAEGRPVGEMATTATPRPATPSPVVDAIAGLVHRQRDFDRASIGFPGVVVDGVVHSAPNLDDGWTGFALAQVLAERLGRPVRVCNDADLAGLTVVAGRGVEMVLTLGTGMGAAVYLDGKLVPNLELGHHPFGDGLSYEQRIADHVLAEIGEDAWRARVGETIELTRRIWNWQHLYLGGGNARLLRAEDLPADVSAVSNEAGVMSAIALWNDEKGGRR